MAGGQNAEQVKQVQTKLNEAGHDVGPVDGIVGPKTQKGLKGFQTSKGLNASGQIDQETLAALGISGSAAGGSSAKSEKKSEGSAAGGSSSASTEKKSEGSAASGSSSASTEKKEGSAASGSASTSSEAPKSDSSSAAGAGSTSGSGSMGSGSSSGSSSGATPEKKPQQPTAPATGDTKPGEKKY
jgi:peptidoglycan hydrolase-like protein with peptidoglycan-binding domain